MKGKFLQFVLGVLTGAALFGGASAAAGVVAEPAWSPIFVDGQQVQMTAYNILGNNYVKLRDIGKAVGFNVYFQGGVQVDSKAPYTGEAPAKPAEAVQIASVKGDTLTVGERSGLMIGSSGADYTVTSSDPVVISVETVLNNWVAIAKAEGTAVITAASRTGERGQLALTVTAGTASIDAANGSGLSANKEVCQEMIRLINQVRRENGVGELAVNAALMDAAQDCARQGFRSHDIQYENESGLRHGYPHGFGSNLTVFTYNVHTDIAQTAVSHWRYSPGHFQTMIAERYDSIGVGVMLRDDVAYCYMFAGNSNSINPYA